MIAEKVIIAIASAFETFFNEALSSDLPLIDELHELMQPTDPKVKDAIKILKKEKIIFIDFMLLYEFFPNVKINEMDAKKKFHELIFSDEAYDLVKLLRNVINDFSIIEELSNDKKKFEIRFTNFRNPKRFTEINSTQKDMLVNLRGVVFHRWDEIRQFPSERIWQCLECGMDKIQLVKRGDKLKKFKGTCLNKIGEGDKAFNCPSRRFIHVKDSNYEDFFRVKIEALPEDTPNKQEYPTFTMEFTHKLCNEKFLNDIITGQAYEFTGFIRLDEVKTNKGDSHFKPYMEVMSYRGIEKKQKRIVITDKEKKELEEFLAHPDAIDKLGNMFAKRVVGFEREKKYFIISKTLQECFNKKRDKVSPQDYITHQLIVGDYATGKSEFAKACLDVCDNGNYIIGSSTSSVGLTGATERDDFTGHYSIQAGMLARSSGDTLVIEEFDKQENKAEFGILNEAMSKFEYTITKAGKSRKFKCHTNIIVVANPIHKKFDTTLSLIPQIDITGDLLSRFGAISCILEGRDLEKQKKINMVMIDRVDPQIIESDKRNAEFIKKCIRISSMIDPSLNTPLVKDFINKFTEQTFAIKDSVLGEDKKFWENLGNPRNRHTLLKLIKGIAMLHLHNEPTKEDMVEAQKLFYEFQRDIVENKSLLDPEELASGMTVEEIKDRVSVSEFKIKVEEKKESKKGRQELFLELFKKVQQESDEGMADIEFLKQKSMVEIGFTEFEFEDLIEKMSRVGTLFHPKAGFVKLM